MPSPSIETTEQPGERRSSRLQNQSKAKKSLPPVQDKRRGGEAAQEKHPKKTLTKINWHYLTQFKFNRIVSLSKEDALILLRLLVLIHVNTDVTTASNNGKTLMNKGLCKLQEQLRLLGVYIAKIQALKIDAVRFSVPVTTPDGRYEDEVPISDLVREAKSAHSRLLSVYRDVVHDHLSYVDFCAHGLSRCMGLLEEGSNDTGLVSDTYSLFKAFFSYEGGIEKKYPTRVYRAICDLRASGKLWDLLGDFTHCCFNKLLSRQAHDDLLTVACHRHCDSRSTIKDQILALNDRIGHEHGLTVEAIATDYWVIIHRLEDLQTTVDELDGSANQTAWLHEPEVFNWLSWLRWKMVTFFEQKISQHEDALLVSEFDLKFDSAFDSAFDLERGFRSTASLSSLSSLSFSWCHDARGSSPSPSTVDIGLAW